MEGSKGGGQSHKVKGENNFYGGVEPSTILSELPISISFGVKRVSWYNYTTFFHVKTSEALGSMGKIKVWIIFSSMNLLLNYWSFYQSANDNWVRIFFS